MILKHLIASFKPYNMAFKFEKLIIWQKAVDLSDVVFNLTKTFPKEELYV
jgi:hypothetical protein